MKIVPLDFNPRKPWPATLPALAWAGVPFTGGDSDDSEAVEMSERVDDFAEALVTAYPILGLGELSRLFKAVEAHPSRALLDIDWQDLFGRYGYRDGEVLRQTLNLLAEAPRAFADWVDEKGLGMKDLAPLRSPAPAEFVRELSQYIAASSPAKNVGVQIIEWAVDLRLLDQDIDFTLAAEELHTQLRNKRFARRTQARVALAAKIKSLPWPKEVQATVVEKGDRLGFEVRIFSENAEDFARKAEQVEACARLLSLKQD
jgi:hypothetical protein